MCVCIQTACSHNARHTAASRQGLGIDNCNYSPASGQDLLPSANVHVSKMVPVCVVSETELHPPPLTASKATGDI